MKIRIGMIVAVEGPVVRPSIHPVLELLSLWLGFKARWAFCTLIIQIQKEEKHSYHNLVKTRLTQYVSPMIILLL